MRFSNPRRRSKFLNPKSASSTAVVAPLLASAMPRFAVKVVLPTPPFPEQINIVRVFSATKFKDFSNDKATFKKVKYFKD